MRARSVAAIVACVALVGAPGPGWADSAVVARVQGPRGAFEISADRLAAYLKSYPDRAPRDALQDLVDFELLAAEAATRGYPAAELQRDVAPVMVRQYLKHDFEQRVRRDTLDPKYMEQSYKQNQMYFVRPELRAADHILVTKAGKLPPELAAAAHALADKVYDSLLANPVEDADDFIERVAPFVDEAKAAGLEIRHEPLGLFQLDGRYDPVFSKAVFETTEAGTIMAPFETTFGVHVVRVDKVLAAKDEPYEKVEDQLRDRVLTDARRYELRDLNDVLAKEYGVEVDVSPLEQLEARRGIEPTTP